MVTTDFEAGGPRPVTVHVPPGYDPATPTPLLILLHGYTATGTVQDAYFGLQPVADARGIIYAFPDGTIDANNSPFWNATDACCNFFGSDVDDVAYLLGLIDEIETKVNVDPSRIYFVGHSNGGFMSYRLACEASDRIAAIVSLAGASFADTADCAAPAPLSVLQIHGDMDDTIVYAGGTIGAAAYPSAADSTAYFATLAGCMTPAMSTGMTTDIDSSIDGDETTIDAYANCDAGYDVELWTIPGGGHIPTLAPGFADKLVDFLMAHPKP
jgi:polyhydroxybutyrate depolymerase